jgi:hypothetical protein
MTRFTFPRGHRDDPGSAAQEEDLVVRQYRYLLRTAPPDALEAAHSEAIAAMAEEHRQQLLDTVRATFLVGDHVSVTEGDKIAHLVVIGERRMPSALLAALPPAVFRDLAARVLDSEASFGLLGGYAAWDGNDPEPEDDSVWAGDGFDPHGAGPDLRKDPWTGAGRWLGTGNPGWD